MTLSSPPVADCRWGKAGDACCTSRRTAMIFEGRGAMVRRLNASRNENPRPEVIEDDMIVKQDETMEHRSC